MNHDCRDAMNAIERHIKTSHAVGKFVVDGLVGRILSSARPRPTSKSSVVIEDGLGDETRPASTESDGTIFDESELALLTSSEMVELIARSTDVEAAAIGEYEKRHRRRRLVLEAVAARTSI